MEKPSTSKDPSAIDYVPPANLGITIMDDFGATTEETPQSFEHVDMERNKEPDIAERNSRDPFETSTMDSTTTGSQGTENSIVEKSNDVVEILEEPQSETLLENVYYVKVQNIEITQPCMVCHGIKVVKYNCYYNGTKTYICCDDCLFQFQATYTNIQLHEYFTKFYSPVQIDGSYKYARQCKQCACYLKAATGILSWEAMDFCKESCLYRYQCQKKFQTCAECGNEVIYKQLGKYAVRFGKMVRQFCSGKCLEDRKRKIKICSYCQKSVPLPKTTVGNKYFCHDICKGRYEHLQLPRKPPFLINRLDACCFVCKSTKPIQMEFDYHRSPFYFCSINCVTIFKFVQNCDPPPKKCHNCSKFVLQQYMERHALHYDNFVHYFCSDICQYIYIITHRRVIACIWCKVKKYNFDMIQKNNYLESTIFVCSLYCLNSLKKSVNTVVSKRKTCFNCGQEVGVYNINLADGKLQTFCSNHCISLYQSQFVATQTQIQPKRTRGRTRQILPDKPGPLPIITSVCSLAPTATKAKGAEITLKKLIVIKPSELPEVRNVCLQVGQITFDKESQDSVECDSQEVQTNIPENGPKLIPIPVPIYVPFPLFSFKAPVPTPVPFPVVIPCPILIPLSKHTSANIMKEIKKDQVKAPSDPFEAELLMMAEIIADDEKEESAGAESADDEDDAAERPEYSPEQADTSAPFGEDMLQMALKMASDFEEPPVDLEGALAASTIAASQAHNIEKNEEASDSQNVSKVSGRGRGRGKSRGVRQNPSRRGRRQAQVTAPVAEQPTSPAEPMEPVEKPDANMCLKYTFGVNAWKQWVITKNTEFERSSRKLKTFKTELLQLTSDELNYSLCLFVKEVRKPNGTEYAPDTIYYLCLGIQQYLYENGRIDNIFCDSYYEKFTDCLDEICQKFSNLYNDSHYIVTRVEEEHLWESKQLGAHSPHVLLSTLMFFNTKHFNLKNVDEHMQLSFSHIMKHWKRNPNQPFVVKQAPSRNVLLRFYPPQSSFESGNRKKKVYEQQENEENPLRCPVKLYEFYLSKCPESVKTRNDVFYLLPERSCVPDSPVWYSTTALDKMALEKMLHRVKMVKEINVALLTN